MSIPITRINNVKVKAVPLIKPADKRPVLGAELYPKLNSNTFMCAKRGSGKTGVIYKSINDCANRETNIVAISGSLHNDKSWLAIQKLCERKGIPFTGHTSIFDEDGDNVLEIFVNRLKAMREGHEEEGGEEGEECAGVDEIAPPGGVDTYYNPELGILPPAGSLGKPKRPRRSKYQSPKWLLILDDISNELKNKWVTAALKLLRHWGKIIISSQSVNDLAPSGRNQLDYVILFKGMPISKLESVWSVCSLDVTMPQLERMYDFATERKYSFLYIDTAENEYRRNFSDRIEIPR